MTSSLSKLLAAVSVLLLSTTLSGCFLASRPSLLDSAAAKAVAETKPPMAEVPERCLNPIPHAEVNIGQSLEGLLKREQRQLDIANGVIVDCAAFQLDERRKLGYETKPGD